MSNAQPQSQLKQDLQIIRRSFLRMSAGAAAAAVATACTNANVGGPGHPPDFAPPWRGQA